MSIRRRAIADRIERRAIMVETRGRKMTLAEYLMERGRMFRSRLGRYLRWRREHA